jgi:hypothetical protein
MEATIEKNNQAQATAPAVNPSKSLDVAKQELGAALRKYKDQVTEAQSNEQRLTEAKKEEHDLLASSLDEERVVDRLSKIVALQRLLESKGEQGRKQLESARSELRRAVQEGFGAFWPALTALREARTARLLATFKEMGEPEKWPYAETHARSFLRFAVDLIAIEFLGDQAALHLSGSRVQQAAEQLLMDVAKLESEAASKPGKGKGLLGLLPS